MDFFCIPSYLSESFTLSMCHFQKLEKNNFIKVTSENRDLFLILHFLFLGSTPNTLFSTQDRSAPDMLVILEESISPILGFLICDMGLNRPTSAGCEVSEEST